MIPILCFFIMGVLVFGIYEILLIPSFIYLVIKKKISRKYGFNFIILIMFCMSYYGIDYINQQDSLSNAIRMFLSNIMMYRIGVSLSESAMERESNEYNKYLVAIALGMLFHGILNVIQTYQMGLWGVTVNIYDFWTKAITLSTYQSTLFTMASAVALYFIVIGKTSLKIMGVSIIALEVYVALTIGSRSMIAILVLMILGLFIYILVLSKISGKYKVRIMAVLMLICTIGLITYSLNLGGVKDTLEATFMWKRFALTNSQESSLFDLSSRTYFYKELIKGISTNPFGGIELRYGASSHNSFLDIIRVSGIIPFMLFVIFTINAVIKLMRVIKKDGMVNKYVLLVSLVFISSLLIFFVESVFVLNKNLVYGFILCCGIIEGLDIHKIKSFLKGEK